MDANVTYHQNVDSMQANPTTDIELYSPPIIQQAIRDEKEQTIGINRNAKHIKDFGVMETGDKAKGPIHERDVA